MTMDLTVDRYETYDDLLGYMDGSAAVIGEMMLPILEPLDPAPPSARPATSATRSSSPTSCATSTRTSTAAASYLPQEDLARFGADLRRAAVTPAFVDADALRDRPQPRAVPLGRRGIALLPGALGPLHRAPPATSTPDPRPDRGQRLRRVRRRGPGCPRRRRLAVVARTLVVR